MRLFLIPYLALELPCVVILVNCSMSGVQSFVAQRQQGQLNPSRQKLGSKHRVPVPMTKLENTKPRPSFQRSNSALAADPPVPWSKPPTSAQKCSEASAVQDGFDTDTEGFDDTTTMSVGGNSRGHQVKGDGCDQPSNRNNAYTTHDIDVEAQVSFGRGQKQPCHVQISKQLDPDSSEEDDGGIREDSVNEEGNRGSDEELVRDGILQELNSPGFSKYLQAKASNTIQSIFKPVVATPVTHNSLPLRDDVPDFQQTANSSTSKRHGSADPGIDLQRANGHERAMKISSAVPFQKVQGASIEQLAMSTQLAAQHRTVSDRHESSLQSLVKPHQTLRSTSRSIFKDIVVAKLQPQANAENALSVQKRPIDLGDDDFPIDYDTNLDSRHDRKSMAAIKSSETQKRARDLDYSPEQLSSVTFHQLSNEPFGLTSDKAPTSIPQELLDSTLAAKLNHILEKSKDGDAKFIQRKAFFSSLSIEQYEECAVLMIRRFSDIMSRFTDTRQQRRRTAKDFEEEVGKREEYVRGKTTVLNRDLGRLKRGGEEVVKGAAL